MKLLFTLLFLSLSASATHLEKNGPPIWSTQDTLQDGPPIWKQTPPIHSVN